MIRLYFDPKLPMLGLVGEQGDDIAVVLNERLTLCSTAHERADLFNTLVRAIEQRGVAVDDDLAERREMREIRRYLASVQVEASVTTQVPSQKVCHGVDTSPSQR